MLRLIAVLIACVTPHLVMAQMPVEVIHSGRDSVGQRLVFYYKEAIRSSASFTLALNPTLGLRVRIVTLDPDDASRGYSTAYSATWTWTNPQSPFDLYLTQYVGLCGASRVRSCAEDLLVTTNNQLEDIQRLLASVRR